MALAARGGGVSNLEVVQRIVGDVADATADLRINELRRFVEELVDELMVFVRQVEDADGEA